MTSSEFGKGQPRSIPEEEVRGGLLPSLVQSSCRLPLLSSMSRNCRHVALFAGLFLRRRAELAALLAGALGLNLEGPEPGEQAGVELLPSCRSVREGGQTGCGRKYQVQADSSGCWINRQHALTLTALSGTIPPDGPRDSPITGRGSVLKLKWAW